MHAKNSLTDNADSYLESTEYLDADHPLVAALADKLTYGAETDVERIRAIYLYVRDLRYDVLESFRYLAAGQRSASAVLEHGVAFCMGKASSFVALSRAAGVPARVAFQTLDSPRKGVPLTGGSGTLGRQTWSAVALALAGGSLPERPLDQARRNHRRADGRTARQTLHARIRRDHRHPYHRRPNSAREWQLRRLPAGSRAMVRGPCAYSSRSAELA
jgi:hypothetical protein